MHDAAEVLPTLLESLSKAPGGAELVQQAFGMALQVLPADAAPCHLLWRSCSLQPVPLLVLVPFAVLPYGRAPRVQEPAWKLPPAAAQWHWEATHQLLGTPLP